MKKRFLMVESSLEHISKLKHLKSEAEMLIFHCFYKQNVISSQTIVAAAALTHRASRCSQSNSFFENVDISKGLATFCVGAEPGAADLTHTSLSMRENPIGQALFGEKHNWGRIETGMDLGSL